VLKSALKRAESARQKVFCVPGNVENKPLTVAHGSPGRQPFFAEIMRRSTDEFYPRWSPGTDKSDFARYNRTRLAIPRLRGSFAECVSNVEFLGDRQAQGHRRL
jgi:hypothetical protein